MLIANVDSYIVVIHKKNDKSRFKKNGTTKTLEEWFSVMKEVLYSTRLVQMLPTWLLNYGHLCVGNIFHDVKKVPSDINCT